MSARRRTMLVVLAATAGLAASPGVARAADWCGTVADADRPAVLAGNPIRVLYAVPSDGADRAEELAPRIAADVDEIDAWWRLNDSSRTPRFDLTTFGCGAQVDLTRRRLSLGSGDLLPRNTRWDRIFDELDGAGLDGRFTKYLVYYDGPVEDENLCGQGGGFPAGSGIAVIYVNACSTVSSASTAAHELLHTLGALTRASAPNSCPQSPSHVCDSTGDILYEFAQEAALASLALDIGRDDYYGHGAPWFDVRDSAWLRRLDAQVPLALLVRGRGSVASDVPGLACAVSCRTEWNAGSALALRAVPAAGQRFVRWSGACIEDSATCNAVLDGPRQLTALFAPARFRLALSVRGQGRITGGGGCVRARCVRSAVSYRTLTLRARPRKGWRLRGWIGGCRGAKPTCTLPMKKAASVRATFVRVPAKR